MQVTCMSFKINFNILSSGFPPPAKELPFYIFKNRTQHRWKQSFALQGYFNSVTRTKTELREREPHFTDGKIEAKKKKERERNKGKGLKNIQTPENNIYNAVMQLRNNYQMCKK